MTQKNTRDLFWKGFRLMGSKSGRRRWHGGRQMLTRRRTPFVWFGWKEINGKTSRMFLNVLPSAAAAGIIIVNGARAGARRGRNAGGGDHRTGWHLRCAWQASCVIYDSVMRQNRVVSLIKVTAQKTRLSWVPVPREHEGLDDASGDIERSVAGIYKQDVFFLSALL